MRDYQTHHEGLYTEESQSDPEALTDFCSNADLPTLSLDQVKSLDGSITEPETRKSIRTMKNSKSPGLDGFLIEYYKQFIDILAPVLEELYNEALFYRLSHQPLNNNITIITS